MLSLTLFDIEAYLEVPEVKLEFDYLYKHGMLLISNDLIKVNAVNVVIVERLIDWTSLLPEKIDKRLGY